MFVGLLFYIPEQDERRIGNSEFSAPSGGRNLEVVVVIVVVIIVIVIVIFIVIAIVIVIAIFNVFFMEVRFYLSSPLGTTFSTVLD